jgi:hypothetical protein
MRRVGVRCFVLALILTAPLSASAWGTKGHRVVASIGEDRLTPEARREVTNLLDPGTTLADISTWADEVRSGRPNSGPWHYVNIPRGASGYNAQRDCGRGCVVSAIEQSLRLLQDPTKGKAIRQEALKWVVHLVADLHQPLHAITDDRGGNDVPVRFFGLPSNLHRVWDSEIIDRTYADPGALRVQVLAAVNCTDRRRWEAGGPEEWAEEAHRAAIDVA